MNETNSNTTTELQTDIEDFKKELDNRIHQKPPLSSVLVDQSLAYLHDAEKNATRDASRAWHDLEQAKLTLTHERPVFAEMHDDGVPVDETIMLKRQFYGMWDDLTEAKRRHPYLNTEKAADWLLRGQKALDKDDHANAFYCAMAARSQIIFAQRCCEQRLLSQYLPIGVILAYIATIVLVVVQNEALVAWVKPASEFAQVPPMVFFWGFLGGVAWCMYSAAQWAKQRLFDWHTLPWYIGQPWVSSILGSAISLVVLAGLTAVTQPGSDQPLSSTTMAVLALVSFAAGFSTKSMWKRLDRTARQLLKDNRSAEDISRDTQQEVMQATQ